MNELYLNDFMDVVNEKREEERKELSILSEISDKDYLNSLKEKGFLYGSLI